MRRGNSCATRHTQLRSVDPPSPPLLVWARRAVCGALRGQHIAWPDSNTCLSRGVPMRRGGLCSGVSSGSRAPGKFLCCARTRNCARSESADPPSPSLVMSACRAVCGALRSQHIAWPDSNIILSRGVPMRRGGLRSRVSSGVRCAANELSCWRRRAKGRFRSDRVVSKCHRGLYLLTRCFAIR